MEIKCLLNSIYKPNVQQGVTRCNKTFNNYVTKSGKNVAEVICDYGKGLTTISEITENQIKNILTNGSIITYTKTPLEEVIINENGIETLSRNSDLWNKLLKNIYKGFQ